ncbi:MAG: UDP-N-acetylmuramoyl-L-alanine--D-glutamate ligase, partial [Chitinophagaceae bacterium]
MVKKLIILGGGESGVGSAILGKSMGYDVFLSDGGKLKEKYVQELKSHDIEFEDGGHDENRILEADEVMKSPGIPHKNEMVKKILNKDVPI